MQELLGYPPPPRGAQCASRGDRARAIGDNRLHNSFSEHTKGPANFTPNASMSGDDRVAKGGYEIVVARERGVKCRYLLLTFGDEDAHAPSDERESSHESLDLTATFSIILPGFGRAIRGHRFCFKC